jgi:hypothetical protein
LVDKEVQASTDASKNFRVGIQLRNGTAQPAESKELVI